MIIFPPTQIQSSRALSRYSHPVTAIPESGFTLLELSIVLTIIALVTGGGFALLAGTITAAQTNTTIDRMNAIEKALLDYSAAFSRIPCPSSLTLTSSDANYGVEAANRGSCTGGTPSANFISASGVAEGGVPVRALRLTDDYMYDGWGNRFRYAADPVYTSGGTLPISAGGPCAQSASPITVNDSTGAARTNAAIYAIVSHGANGHGAYTSGGGTVSFGSINTDELRNCNCNSSGWYAGTYTPTYVQKAPVTDPANAQNGFDDIVTFKEHWQMRKQESPLASAPVCIYVVDWNPRVQIFDPASGAYLGQWGGWNSNVNGGLWNPGQLTLDSAGNIWEVDALNFRLQKFDKYGNFLMGIGAGYNGAPGAVGSSGLGNGQFENPNGVAVDPSGNIWAADIGGNRVEKFNSSGTFLLGIGAGYNGVAGTIGSTGSAPGQFKVPSGLTLDSSGDLWVVDTQNYRLEEFNSSGTFMNVITFAYGTGNGQFIYPTSAAFDPNGNIWIADTNEGRVQKVSPTGTWIRTVGGGASCTGCASATSCSCNPGSANGMLSSMIGGLTVDPSGNLWVIDGWCCGNPTNERVQEFSDSGIWIRSIGGPSPHTCQTSPSGSIPACTAGSGNGQFNQPFGIAVGKR